MNTENFANIKNVENNANAEFRSTSSVAVAAPTKDLRSLSEEELIGNFKGLILYELKAIARVVEYIAEIERRELHLKLGFPSLLIQRELPRQEAALPKSEVRYRGDESVVLTLKITPELFAELNQIKNIYSHIAPGADWVTLLQLMSRDLPKKRNRDGVKKTGRSHGRDPIAKDKVVSEKSETSDRPKRPCYSDLGHLSQNKFYLKSRPCPAPPQ